MKRLFMLGVVVGLLFGLIVSTGCGAGTIYSVAVDKRSVGTILSDETTKNQVRAKIFDDKELKLRDVSVYCFRGTVYLVGITNQETDQERLIALASSVKGVRDVSTFLLPKDDSGTGRYVEDSTITAKVKAKIVGDADLRAPQFEVETLRGTVVLLGIVGSERDMAVAERYARNVEGVLEVKSFLRTQ